MKKFLIIFLLFFSILAATGCQAATGNKSPRASVRQKAGITAAITPIKSLDDIDTLMQSLGIHRFKKGIVAPNFTLKNLEGKTVSLKDYRGQFVLMSFMATWCYWCRKEMPHIQKLYDLFRDKDFVILTVFTDRGGARAVKPFIKKTGYTFTKDNALLDNTGKVAGMYGITGTPTAYIIGRDGTAIGGAVGYRDWSQKSAVDLIEKLLSYRGTK